MDFGDGLGVWLAGLYYALKVPCKMGVEIMPADTSEMLQEDVERWTSVRLQTISAAFVTCPRNQSTTS
jgi:hypothetical protein